MRISTFNKRGATVEVAWHLVGFDTFCWLAKVTLQDPLVQRRRDSDSMNFVREFGEMKHSKVVSVFCCVLMSVVVFPLTGCGPSQEDLMMRAARRQRPKDAGDIEDEKREKSKSTKPAASEPKPNEVETLVAAAGKSEPPPAEVVEDKPELVEMSFPPIEERKPATPLSEAERRRQSLENITKLADALQKFYIDKKRFPQSFQVSRSKIPTLSWRVEILPYLGYQDLYDQFDFTMPWDREPNKSLLSYIPPEFVSPERFDTKTNYLLPADRAFMFGENRSPRIRDVDDGVDNTIMMVEVNDDLAVEWTSPRDYIPKNKTKIVKRIGWACAVMVALPFGPTVG